MDAIGLAFLSSVCWGAADFVGGLKSRALPLLNVILVSQATGLVLVCAFVLVRGEGAPGGDFAMFAVLSALSGIVGLSAFYRAVLGSLYPLTTVGLAAVVLGERPRRLALVGVLMALWGVALVTAG